MHNKEFPLSLIPERFIHYISIKTLKKGESLFKINDKNIYYILSGNAIYSRFNNDKSQKIFPYILKSDEFVGINAYLTGKSDWEVIAFSENLKCIQIPAKIFDDYILTTKIFTKIYLPKNNLILSYGVRGFYIYSQGGTLPYLAFILDLMDDKLDQIRLTKFSDLTKVAYTSKSNLYNLINQLIDEKIINKTRNTIKILNKQKLRQHYEAYKY